MYSGGGYKVLSFFVLVIIGYQACVEKLGWLRKYSGDSVHRLFLRLPCIPDGDGTCDWKSLVLTRLSNFPDLAGEAELGF